MIGSVLLKLVYNESFVLSHEDQKFSITSFVLVLFLANQIVGIFQRDQPLTYGDVTNERILQFHWQKIMQKQLN